MGKRKVNLNQATHRRTAFARSVACAGSPASLPAGRGLSAPPRLTPRSCSAHTGGHFSNFTEAAWMDTQLPTTEIRKEQLCRLAGLNRLSPHSGQQVNLPSVNFSNFTLWFLYPALCFIAMC
jgi:hypothetical protein